MTREHSGSWWVSGLIAIAFLVVSFWLSTVPQDKISWVPVTAHVRDVQLLKNAFNAVVTYVVSGTNYEARVSGASWESVDQGQEMAIRYCPTDPSLVIREPWGNNSSKILLVIAVVFGLVTIASVSQSKSSNY